MCSAQSTCELRLEPPNFVRKPARDTYICWNDVFSCSLLPNWDNEYNLIIQRTIVRFQNQTKSLKNNKVRGPESSKNQKSVPVTLKPFSLPLVIKSGHAKGNYPHLTLLEALTGTSEESTRQRLLYYKDWNSFPRVTFLGKLKYLWGYIRMWILYCTKEKKRNRLPKGYLFVQMQTCLSIYQSSFERMRGAINYGPIKIISKALTR